MKGIPAPFRACALAASVIALAGCTGETPPAPSAAAREPDGGPAWFEESSRANGLEFVHLSGHREQFYMPESMGGGAALVDFDEDGDLDVYLVQAGSVTEPSDRPGNRLFRNRGDGTFEDVTTGSGTEVRGYGMGAAAGDYDNDGDVDLYVTNVGANALLRNDGGGRFTDVTAAARVGTGAWSTSAGFFDYDADGDLDLFVGNYIRWSPETELPCYSLSGAPDYCSPRNYDAPVPDTLYRNDGDGTFTDVSAEAGLHTAFGNALGVTFGDFNRDGRQDVFVANDATLNQLWINRGDGRFEDVALEMGAAMDQDGRAKAGMGVHAADPDEDGDLDLLVVNLDGESDSFYRNDGEYFVDDTPAVGLRAVSRPFTRFGMALLDFDNDGHLDLFQANGRVGLQSELYADDPYAEPNLLYQGVNGRFEEVRPRGGTSPLLIATSRGAAFGDVNNDGALDILVVNRDAPVSLLMNRAPSRGNWLMLRLVEEHGRDAIGASVSLTVGGRRLHRDVRTAFSYLASNDPRVHVGLGDHDAATDVVVRWIDGREEAFGDLDGGRIATLRRGTGIPGPPRTGD